MALRRCSRDTERYNTFTGSGQWRRSRKWTARCSGTYLRSNALRPTAPNDGTTRDMPDAVAVVGEFNSVFGERLTRSVIGAFGAREAVTSWPIKSPT